MEKTITSQDLLKEIEAIKAKKEIVDADFSALKEKRYAEIKIIEDKYEERMSAFNEEVYGYKEEISSKQKEMHELIKKEEWREAVGRGVINEFYFSAMLKRFNISSSDTDFKIKKELDNGIVVWMIDSSGYTAYKAYFAFFEGNLIGTSYRETARHAGDATTPYSFIGQFDNILMETKTYDRGFRKGEEYEVNATFTAWMREIKKLDVDEVTLIPMNEDTVEEIEGGMVRWWSDYGWSDREKEKNK